jgi:hypothetical protein
MNLTKINVLTRGLMLAVMLCFFISAYSQVTDKAKSNVPLIKLTGTFLGSANGYYDETAVFFAPVATYGFNPRTDAHKLMNTEQTMPNLYTIKDNQDLAINGLPAITDNLVVPVGFDVWIPGTYKINASEISNVNTHSVNVYLEDLAMNVQQDIVANPEYLFTINPADKGGRFFLIFKLAGSGLTQLARTDRLNLYTSCNKLFVNNNTKETTDITVTNLQGQKVFEVKGLTAGNHQYTLKETPGLYLVKMVSNNIVKTQKIYIY